MAHSFLNSVRLHRLAAERQHHATVPSWVSFSQPASAGLLYIGLLHWTFTYTECCHCSCCCKTTSYSIVVWVTMPSNTIWNFFTKSPTENSKAKCNECRIEWFIDHLLSDVTSTATHFRFRLRPQVASNFRHSFIYGRKWLLAYGATSCYGHNQKNCFWSVSSVYIWSNECRMN